MEGSRKAWNIFIKGRDRLEDTYTHTHTHKDDIKYWFYEKQAVKM